MNYNKIIKDQIGKITNTIQVKPCISKTKFTCQDRSEYCVAPSDLAAK